MDGWLLPVYCWRRNEKGGKEYFFRYNLFTVMDAHSRKIIGYDIAESENTENILKGLEKAVRNTNILPFEIVADNHSFNKTKEADNLKSKMEALGVTWTVDSNPRRKAILERSFRTLGENYFKDFYGYIGQGIKSRIKNGITQQELKDIYTKPANMLSYEQVCAIAYTAIYEYNNGIRKSLGESPEQRFSRSEQPNSIKIDNYTCVSLFHRQSEYKVSHGQIVIQRGMHRYEYALPAKYAAEYNGKRVGVRYYDFDEIYVYDLATDAPICHVAQKIAIHGAVANQTPQDIEYLQHNSGRIRGVNSRMEKRRESLFDAANTVNPYIFEAANKVTTSKDVLKTAAQNIDIRAMLAQQGITIERIAPFPEVDEMLNKSLKPRPKKENKHPFSVKPDEIKTIQM
ncbi:transposase family protein [Alistipes sp. OttesenSCG-928-B03]|nr:transposase family protein [Alistipes sp. OttesenSCG-928-B03]